MREAKKDYKIKLSEKITSGKFSSKDWWKTIKTLLGKDKMDDIPPLIKNGQPINDPNHKANIFNQYFQSQTELDDSNIPVLELPQLNFSLSSTELNTEEVQSTLNLLSLAKHAVLIKLTTEY